METEETQSFGVEGLGVKCQGLDLPLWHLWAVTIRLRGIQVVGDVFVFLF